MITKDLFIVRSQSSFTQRSIVLMRETVIIWTFAWIRMKHETVSKPKYTLHKLWSLLRSTLCETRQNKYILKTPILTLLQHVVIRWFSSVNLGDNFKCRNKNNWNCQSKNSHMVFIERHAITLLDDCLYAKPMSQTMQYPLFLVYSKFIYLDIRYCILNETPSHHKWVHGVRICLLKCGDGYFSLASTQQANCFLSDQSRRQIFPPFDLQYIPCVLGHFIAINW